MIERSSPSYKPNEYTSVAPYLIVPDAVRTIDFLIQVFDAVPLRRFARAGGGIMHAEVRIDDTVLMLADSTEESPAAPYNVHIYVPDVDATYGRALAAGATSVQEPSQRGDPDRRGGVQDHSGVTWWIATQIDAE
jgi:PhnB protein